MKKLDDVMLYGAYAVNIALAIILAVMAIMIVVE